MSARGLNCTAAAETGRRTNSSKAYQSTSRLKGWHKIARPLKVYRFLSQGQANQSRDRNSQLLCAPDEQRLGKTSVTLAARGAILAPAKALRRRHSFMRLQALAKRTCGEHIWRTLCVLCYVVRLCTNSPNKLVVRNQAKQRSSKVPRS